MSLALPLSVVSVVACGCGVVISSYTAKSLGLPEASIVMLLTVFIGEGLRDAFDPKPKSRYQ